MNKPTIIISFTNEHGKQCKKALFIIERDKTHYKKLFEDAGCEIEFSEAPSHE